MHLRSRKVGIKTGSKPKVFVGMFFNQHIYYKMAVKDVTFTHALNYCSDCWCDYFSIHI